MMGLEEEGERKSSPAAALGWIRNVSGSGSHTQQILPQKEPAGWDAPPGGLALVPAPPHPARADPEERGDGASGF